MSLPANSLISKFCDEVAQTLGRLFGMGERRTQPLDMGREKFLIVGEECYPILALEGVRLAIDRLARGHLIARIIAE